MAAKKEWDFKLDLAGLDPCVDLSQMIARAEDAVKKRYEEERKEYKKDLEEERKGTEGDGFWRKRNESERYEMERKEMEQIEREMLKKGGRTIEDVEVDGPDVKIHTILYDNQERANYNEELAGYNEDIGGERIETDSRCPIPILMIHGLGGTAVEFLDNYGVLSKDRDVYGIDIPGFGLSTRNTNYATDAGDCEERMVKLLESWREKKGINEMVIVGHSLGGYVAMVYAMKHRKRVRHLVLIEPWGMLSKDESEKLKVTNPLYKQSPIAIEWAMALSKSFRLKPFTLARVAGKAIVTLLYEVLLGKKQKSVYGIEAMKYFIAVNTLHDPSGSGEDMFCVLSGHSYIYPVRSLQSRLPHLSNYPSMTLVYGNARQCSHCCGKISFIEEGNLLRDEMLKKKGLVKEVEVLQVPDSTHHAHKENSNWFHTYMEKLLEGIDDAGGRI